MSWKGDEDYGDNDDDNNHDADNNEIRVDVVHLFVQVKLESVRMQPSESKCHVNNEVIFTKLVLFLFFLQAALQTQGQVFLEYFHLSPLKVYVFSIFCSIEE